MQGIIIHGGQGWWIVEADTTSEAVFVHHSQVAGNRYLHLNDRIEFDIAPNPKKPGQNEAHNVCYVGHVVRQVVEEGGRQ